MGQNSLLEIEVPKLLEKTSCIIENTEKLNNNGIVEVKYENGIYKTWTVTLVRPLITKFLKEKYPDSLIISEFGKIDITVFDNILNDQIPVEIQKTPIGSNRFVHCRFEDSIRRQVDI